MGFYSRSNYPETIPCPKCEKTVPKFELKINKDTGRKELKENGRTDTYEIIQAAKEGTMIYNILERYQNGEIEVLNKTQGVYGDFTQMPRTLAEAQQTLIDAENTFKTLPLEVRKEFNHSTSEFLASMANGTYETVMRKFGALQEETNPIETQVQQPQQYQEHFQGGISNE